MGSTPGPASSCSRLYIPESHVGLAHVVLVGSILDPHVGAVVQILFRARDVLLQARVQVDLMILAAPLGEGGL